MELTLFNGERAGISADHRALAFGDGIFETLLCRGGYIEYLDAHFLRLNKGARVLNLSWSEIDSQNLKRDLAQLLDGVKGSEQHALKVMLLRSFAGRGYDYDPDTQQTDIVIQLKPYRYAEWMKQGAYVLAGQPISENPVMAGIKHLNRLDSVLAKAAAKAVGAHEMLMVDQQGQVIEGSMSNVFVKQNGHWSTPPLLSAGVEGIIRQQILASYPEISERPLFTSELETVQSAFICNSLIGVVPVLRLNQWQLDVDPIIEQYKQELVSRC